MRYILALLVVMLFASDVLFMKTIQGNSQTKVEATVMPIATPTPAPHLNPDKLFTRINEYRANHGLNKLAWDTSLCSFAGTRLMQIHSDFSHNGFYPIAKSQYSSIWTGENLSKGYPNDDMTYNGWIHSPEHLENIVNPVFKRTCLTTDSIGFDTYAVQEFASY
jgi:uncharacterized protein YkwD